VRVQDELEEDIHFLRRQGTVTDVNTTRTINYELAKTRAAGAASSSTPVAASE
jgi:hypothetical protein